MYIIILAAGRGSRLRPLTDSRPKSLIEITGKSLLDWQLSVIQSTSVLDTAIVRGYMKEAINYPNVTYFENPAYEKTNMVETLWCAEPIFKQGFIVSYGDIIYEKRVLELLLNSKHSISVVVDKGWLSYWRKRFNEVLDDAETLRVEKNGKIISIGQKAESLAQIKGQYIGLSKFQKDGIDALRSIYEQAKQDAKNGFNPLRGQRPLQRLFMTDILQGIIDSGFPVYQIPIHRGWLEIDSISDINLAERSIEILGDGFKIID